MKKEDLKKFLGRDLGDWEIVNISYEPIKKTLELLLQEFVWKGVPFGRDFKEYTGNIKKIKFCDKYGFNYYEDGCYVNAMQFYVKSLKGLKIDTLTNILNRTIYVSTTEIQTVRTELQQG